MDRHIVFLFGEAEKGEFCTPLICQSLSKLADTFGHPPKESMGIAYAIQTLLYGYEVVYFRVREEGFSIPDYMKGIKLLENKEQAHDLAAICMPGVGDEEIIHSCFLICKLQGSILIVSQRDLYDYLTVSA